MGRSDRSLRRDRRLGRPIRDHEANVQDIRSRITVAFQQIRKHKVIARQKFWCCSGCALAAVAPELDEKPNLVGVVFYHEQDADRLRETGAVSIRFSAAEGRGITTKELGDIIVAHLTAAGLTVDWDGNPGRVIEVTGVR